MKFTIFLDMDGVLTNLKNVESYQQSRIIHIENGWLSSRFNKFHYNILRTRILQEIKYGEN